MAWTDPRTWTDGELVTAAIMNPHVRDNFRMTMHTLARKATETQVVNNSTTLVNDSHLSWTVAANDVWHVQAWLLVDSATAADIKFGWTVPASATIQWGFVGADASANLPMWNGVIGAATALATTGTVMQAGSGVGTVIGTGLVGLVTVAGTGGTVQLQWAQQTATVADTKLRLNSCLIGCRLA